MAGYTTTLTYNSTACTWNPTGPFNLEEGDTLTISFSSFPSGSTMSSVTLTPRSPSRPRHRTPAIF